MHHKQTSRKRREAKPDNYLKTKGKDMKIKSVFDLIKY